jgi:hypothetical protein
MVAVPFWKQALHSAARFFVILLLIFAYQCAEARPAFRTAQIIGKQPLTENGREKKGMPRPALGGPSGSFPRKPVAGFCL